MSEMNRGGVPAGETPELDSVWGVLETGLASYLATMVEPDHLLVELTDPDPDGQGCPPYAQFAALDDGRMLRGELTGNAYLTAPYELGEDACRQLRMMGWLGNDEDGKNWYVERPVAAVHQTADEVIFALRHLFGVSHPELLTHQAWGPAADRADVLGLCATDDVPVEAKSAPGCLVHSGALALAPDGRDDLLRAVEVVLREKYGDEPVIDDDGDFVLHHLGQPVWVRVRGDQPAVEIMARVAHDVYSRRATAIELGLLNRDNLWARWTLRDRTVWQSIVVPGMPFAPMHLDAMLDVFFQAMTSSRDDLALRLRAKVA